MKQYIKQIIEASRPRFWIYTLGPYIIGLIAGYPPQTLSWPLIIGAGLFFLFPANLFIYGTNDFADQETDQINAKKQGYESYTDTRVYPVVMYTTILTTLPLLYLSYRHSLSAFLFLVLFIILGITYSLPPIRFKSRPFFDSLSNILYAVPGFFSYTLITGVTPPLAIILASTLWCAAMHAYSAIPDIIPDKATHISTIATTLGNKKTLILCFLCYISAGILSYTWISWVALVGISIYSTLMFLSYTKKDAQIFTIYRIFPIVNTLFGALLCIYLIFA